MGLPRIRPVALYALGLTSPPSAVITGSNLPVWEPPNENNNDYRPPSLLRVPQTAQLAPIQNDAPRVGRNDPCPCGSRRKFKRCCGRA